MIPNIKVVDDKQFIEHCFSIARKILDMDVQLNADQFLTAKYFERKLEFISRLAKSVYDKSEAIRKSKAKYASNFAAQNNKALLESNIGSQNYLTEMIDDEEDDCEEERPR